MLSGNLLWILVCRAFYPKTGIRFSGTRLTGHAAQPYEMLVPAAIVIGGRDEGALADYKALVLAADRPEEVRTHAVARAELAAADLERACSIALTRASHRPRTARPC